MITISLTGYSNFFSFNHLDGTLTNWRGLIEVLTIFLVHINI